MRRLVLTVLLAFWALTAHAQTAPDVAGVRDVIASQIDAFRARDAGAAFAHASPFIQDMFGSADNFAAMVRGGYPMVWDPAGVTFVDQTARGSAIWQRLEIVDNAGAVHWFAYEMVQVDGIWRINGVFRIAPPVIGV